MRHAPPMLVGPVAPAVSLVLALSPSPETRGQELPADLVVAGADD